MNEQHPSKELCKHDWVGDNHCAYCEADSLRDAAAYSDQFASLILILTDHIVSEDDDYLEVANEALQELVAAKQARAAPEPCPTHAAEHRTRDTLPCPWCVIDELKRGREQLQTNIGKLIGENAELSQALLERASEPPTPSPLDHRVFLIAESGQGHFQLRIGFDSNEAMNAAHDYLIATRGQSTKEVLYPCKQCGRGMLCDGDYCSLACHDGAATETSVRLLARLQPCGCIVCTCDDDQRCHGCGAKHCGTHPVSELPNPRYADEV